MVSSNIKQDNLEGKNGIVKARFYLEKNDPIKEAKERSGYYPTPIVPWPHYTPKKPYLHGPDITCSANLEHMDFEAQPSPVEGQSMSSKPGVTVEGSHSSKRYTKVDIDLENDYTTLFLYLKGFSPELDVVSDRGHGEKSLQEDLKQKSQPRKDNLVYCPDCGAKKMKASQNFCHICGNKLS